MLSLRLALFGYLSMLSNFKPLFFHFENFQPASMSPINSYSKQNTLFKLTEKYASKRYVSLNQSILKLRLFTSV